MPYYPDQHHRRSIRIPGYDYSTPGAYFLTICTERRRCVFGEVADGEMLPNDAGRMVVHWWHELSRKFEGTHPGELVVMPNHIHGILYLRITPHNQPIAPTEPPVGAALRGCPPRPRPGPPGGAPKSVPGSPAVPDGAAEGAHAGAPLPEIVGWFKTMSTNAYIRGVRRDGWPRFEGRLWQRNYFERVLRNEEKLNAARRYIEENPARWALDPERPR